MKSYKCPHCTRRFLLEVACVAHALRCPVAAQRKQRQKAMRAKKRKGTF